MSWIIDNELLPDSVEQVPTPVDNDPVMPASIDWVNITPINWVDPTEESMEILDELLEPIEVGEDSEPDFIPDSFDEDELLSVCGHDLTDDSNEARNKLLYLRAAVEVKKLADDRFKFKELDDKLLALAEELFSLS